ncbi:RDD family protein [Ornithinibacillus salinisoli]|uniref:RDD family protein n=1 Tax=Ornithinibacillus salinisoli TaxID=1848459 RepID=A0ABW4VTM0_9BACI
MVNNPAGFWVRLGASIVDTILLTIVFGFVGLIIYNQFFVEDFSVIDILDMLYFLLLPIFWYGYTVGKRVSGIRIARIDGEKLGLGTMLLRDVVAGVIYLITFGIGVIVSAFMVGLREDKRSIHDFIAGTYVTYDEPGYEE